MLSPATLVALRNLSLAARMVVDGFRAGLHASRQRGAGLEFNQYRSYQPGDDLRQLDWKLFARSDRYYIREAETESALTVRFILDTSASMAHLDEEISKLDYARLLIAALAYLAGQQGDQVYLYLLQEGAIRQVTARPDGQQLPRLWHELEKVTATGRLSVNPTLTPLQQLKQKTLTILLSDMYEHQHELSALLPQLGPHRHEVLLFHMLARNELDFTFTGPLTFEDLETGQTVTLRPEQRRPSYQQHFQNWLQQLETNCRRQHITYHRLLINEPLDAALRRFLTARTTAGLSRFSH